MMIKRLFCVALISYNGALAATNNVTATAVHRLWSTGNNSNGSCFDSANQGATGVDYSKATGPQVTMTTTLSTSGAGSTTLTATGSPFDNTMLGNCIHITAGTNFTQGFYVITGFTDANNVTLNVSPSPAGAGSVGTARIGGAVADMATAETAVVAGNTVYVKATAAYSIAASITFTTSGSSGLPITWIGYTTTDTDGGQVTIQASAGSINMWTGTATFQRFRNFILDCTSKATCRCFNESGAQVNVVNVKATGFTLSGFNTNQGQFFHNIWATAGASGCTAGIVAGTTGTGWLDASASTANPCPGIQDTNTSAATPSIYTRVISANNTGASSDGYQKTAAGAAILNGVVLFGNGRDGARFTTATSMDTVSIRNSVAVSNAGYGFNSTTTDWSTQAYWMDFNFNAYYNNSPANLNQIHAGGSDATLTGDPYVSGSTGNFALNSTAGAGAALKAAGFPGTVQFGGTGYIDIGALQHQDSAAAAAISHPIIQ